MLVGTFRVKRLIRFSMIFNSESIPFSQDIAYRKVNFNRIVIFLVEGTAGILPFEFLIFNQEDS